MDDGTGDKPGGVGTEVGHQGRHFSRLRHATQRDLAGEFPVERRILPYFPVDARPGEPGADRVDQDPVLCPFRGHGARECAHRTFGGSVGAVETAALNVFVDDGKGFIDLGYDNYLEYDGDEDLILGFDGTWLTVDGHMVAFYMTEAEEEGTYGRIPVRLTRQGEDSFMNLRLFIDQEGNVTILGFDPLYDGETDTQAKGAIPVEQGDVIQPLCDYYNYDGTYESSCELGDAFTVNGTPTVEYLTLDNAGSLSVSYRLTDIYGSVYWTPASIY